MLKYTEDYLTIDKIKIHYCRTGGDKPPFILLHGASDSGLCWAPTAEWLSAQYDVIMPDAQGHGLSDRLDADFTYQRHREQAVALIRELGLKKPLIMGHSMGAGTAVNIAVEYPSFPRAIILEDPPWMTMDPNVVEPDEAKMKQHDDFWQFLKALGKRSTEEIIAESRKMDPGWAEAERLPWAQAKQRFDTNLFKKPLLNELSYEELVPRIKCPALLIISDGGIVTRKTAEKAAELWKGKQPFKWVQIKGAGHNIRREQFKEFKKAISAFLKALPA
jgi:N-formylmaleamate deformylase